MDSSTYSKSDPLVLLLNEIEILLGQTRLMELHLKRAEAASNDKMARLQEQYQEELKVLRSALAAREEGLAAQEHAAAQERDLRERIQFLETRLSEERRVMENRDAEILKVRSDITDLENRFGQLEVSYGQAQGAVEESALARQTLEAELVASRLQLEEKQRHFQTSALAASELQRRLQAQLLEVRHQLQQTDGRAERADAELDQSRNDTAALRDRLAELEAREQKTQSRAAEEREQSRGRFDAELAELRSALEMRDQVLRAHQSAALEIEHRLKDDVLKTREELEQQRALAAARDEQLRNAHARVAALEQRAAYFEAANQEIAANAQQLDSVGRSQEAEIAALRHQVTAQERALTERQEAVTAVELALHSRIQSINQDLARSRREIEEQRALSEATRRQWEEGSQQARNLSMEWDRSLGAKDEELHALRSELNKQKSALEARDNESEQLRRELEHARRESETKLQEMDARLKTREAEWLAAQSSEIETEHRLAAKIDELRLQVAEKHLLVESRAAEIESLKTSATRLSEQLAQQQAIENEIKAEFVTEVEATRAAHRSDVDALQEERRAERQTLENELAQERQSSADLQRQILELEDRHRETEALLKSREQDTATERGRLEQLESLRETERAVQVDAEQAQNGLQTELAALREELQGKAWSLARQQAAIENLALAHKNQLQKLDTRIDEQQRAISDRDSELEKTRAQTQALGRRIEELQDELRKTERTALNGTQRLNEEHAMNIEDRNKQSLQSGAEIERRASDAELEQTLRDEIERLRREAQEKNQILQDRNDELVRVKAQLDGLHERLNQLESSTFEAENASDSDAERMRTEFQAQLALLQAELSQKEWALEERQAKTRGMEQALRQEIDSLRRQVAENESAERQAIRNFVFDEPQSNHAQDPHFEIAGTATAESAIGSFAGHRRWNTGFGWKRRWRS